MSDTAPETLPGTSKDSGLIPGYSSMEQFTKDGFKVLMEAIKHANALPAGRDWDFYTVSESFNNIMKDECDTVLRLMNQVMNCNEIDSNIRNRVLDEKMELLIEANDNILEKVANNIDELNGIHKAVAAPVEIQTVSAQLPVNGSWNRQTAAIVTIGSKVAEKGDNSCIKLITAKNIVRPQKFFKDKIDNRNKFPWEPRISEKPNNLKPLAIFLEECDDRQEYSHPYEYELDRFVPIPSQLLDEKAKMPKPITETPLIEVDKPEQLDELVETLRQCTEFGVDVEHHSYRSFMGITCLLQISTNEKDYIIDTLALRDKLSILNEVFTKNTIVKIFHGADRDIEWLQRDLSLYVVNMFDTHQAAKVLQYPALSLAFLMKRFCNIFPNKQFQLADWRMRPLPIELKNYAREDTHYLIYIYKMLKKELLKKANKSDNLLRSVIERSTEICKKRYFKPILHEDSHLDIYHKCKKLFDNRQLYALKEIYAWRDNLAREEDESLAYVLPNHMLLQISEALPREMQGILACCSPIPPLVRSHLLELHQIILKARDQPLEKAILKDTRGRGALQKVSKVNVDAVLHCPHDLSKTNEFRDDLPTLLMNDQYKNENKNIAKEKLSIEKPSSYSVFIESFDSDDVKKRQKTFKKIRGVAYFSPYERYKLVKPFVVAEDEAAQKQNDEENENKNNETVEKKTQEERTDDDRIAGIRDHFVQLSRKFSEELQAQKQKEEEERKKDEERQWQRERSLRQMGGSRKRKREEIDDSEQLETISSNANNFHSTLPRNLMLVKDSKKNRGKKRKFNEMNDCSDQRDHMPGKRSKKNKQKKKQQQNQNRRYSQQQNRNQNRQVGQQHNRNCQGDQPQNQNGNLHLNQQQNQNRNRQQPDVGEGEPNQSQKKQYRPKNFGKQNQNFAPFDYASVDFRQFQGGAGSARGGVQMKQGFRGKNRKNNNSNRGAKSATFGGSPMRRGGGQGRNR